MSSILTTEDLLAIERANHSVTKQTLTAATTLADLLQVTLATERATHDGTRTHLEAALARIKALEQHNTVLQQQVEDLESECAILENEASDLRNYDK